MRFSILLPTRNGDNFLDNCIRSILEQDHADFELIISDNANTDATPDIIRTFSSDPRLTVVHQKKPILNIPISQKHFEKIIKPKRSNIKQKKASPKQSTQTFRSTILFYLQ